MKIRGKTMRTDAALHSPAARQWIAHEIAVTAFNQPVRQMLETTEPPAPGNIRPVIGARRWFTEQTIGDHPFADAHGKSVFDTKGENVARDGLRRHPVPGTGIREPRKHPPEADCLVSPQRREAVIGQFENIMVRPRPLVFHPELPGHASTDTTDVDSIVCFDETHIGQRLEIETAWGQRLSWRQWPDDQDRWQDQT